MTDPHLEHYGVKGMKWGVRNDRRSKSSRSRPTRSKASSDHVTSRSLMKNPTPSLSNDEIKKINERLNLEQSYKRLNPSTVSKGKAAAQASLATLGLGFTAYNMTNSAAGKAFIAAGKKILSGRLPRTNWSGPLTR